MLLNSAHISKPAIAIAIWTAIVVGILTGTAFLDRQRQLAELATESAILHRLASQRAEQHDAHLTSLSAVFVAGGDARRDLFLEVAASITRFYPRIASIHVVAMNPTIAGIDSRPGLNVDDMGLIRELAETSTGQLQIAQSLQRPDHYVIVKRTPNSDDAKHALALMINAEALLETDSPYWQHPSVSRRLSTPSGNVLVGDLGDAQITQSKTLGSRSQPLVLATHRQVSVSDFFPLGRVALTLLVATVVVGLAGIFAGQWSRRQQAERTAALSEQETRLAHATRVNALGEMASGMAHELAQPLTAILSQAQAGRHLVRRGDMVRLKSVMDDTVAQAQRAADILERLRRWSKPEKSDIKTCALNEAAQNVFQLLEKEAQEKGAVMTLLPSDPPVMISADPVELEQVIFNLARNALDAGSNQRVTISIGEEKRRAILDVTDTGPGIPDDIKDRIFEPFVTGKPDGTGLGLALCERLVEEMDGEITLVSHANPTRFRLSFPVATEGGQP